VDLVGIADDLPGKPGRAQKNLVDLVGIADDLPGKPGRAQKNLVDLVGIEPYQVIDNT